LHLAGSQGFEHIDLISWKETGFLTKKKNSCKDEKKAKENESEGKKKGKQQ